ncbi:p-type calcium atpase [Trichoderma arundinaceum]|uniref:Calcium-transporting ATPase n=1 Tax=Trichoderma arundinaceum TaxID=490622 RepID=A0A395NTY6_TRIAR|nr:p-type calcium atpase [Trichoderma arundinaceum]
MGFATSIPPATTSVLPSIADASLARTRAVSSMDEITPADSVTRHHVDAGKQATALISELRAEEPVPSNHFAFTPSQLHKLLKQRSLAALDVFGGLRGLVLGLRTNLTAGLNADEWILDGAISFDEAVAAARQNREPFYHHDDVSPAVPPIPFDAGSWGEHFIDRRRVFGENRLPRRRQKSFLKLMWIAFNDKLMILLTISACISLGIGLYQSLTADEDTSNIEWVDGVTVVAAIIVIVLASAATDWQKNHRFEKLNERQQQRDVTVLRSGRIQKVSIYHILVGDVMHIEAGEVVAADGILVQGSSLYIDESSITGETQLVHKKPPGEHGGSRALPADPFIFSGTTVCRGVGRFLVLSIGENSAYGRTLMSLREDVEETPLQAKLGRLGKQLIMFGAAAGAIYFLILFIRFLVRLPRHKHARPTQKAEAFLHIVMLAVTIVVITVPEGLALNVTVALAFATTRMLKDHNLVRLIRSCEIMGNATSICSDKTGTLTQNKMAIVAGRVGLESGFEDCEIPVTSSSTGGGSSASKLPSSKHFMSTVSPQVQSLIKDSIALNSTAFERDDSAGADFIGSSTETALLKFGRDHLGMGKLREERANSPFVAMLPFDSARKWMAVLIKLPNGRYRLLVKGAAEIVFEYCAYIVADPTFRFTTARLEESDRASFRRTIHDYAVNMLRPVAMSFRDFDENEVFENPDDDPASVNLEWLASGMVFIGFFGIQDPIRPGVVDSVRKCQDAGVFVRMVTGDNFLTAKAIAAECGIYTAGGVAMDGPTFRKLTPSQRDAIIPRLQVLARSSPEDKLLLVTRLREMKETVAVTGDGTNDALALKAADVGFAMGMQGTEVAKEAASIILLDDNFASIVKALSWGRTVIDAVKKFIQFQFTINITAGITTVISELVGDSIFTVVQLLWINLIMDIFASLAFATDHPSPDFLMRKPEPRNTTIVSITMWKMIIGQSIYQLLVVFLVHYVGWDIFNPDTKHEIDKLQTLVFNIYVWMQFFNQHNCRRVDNKLDIWYQGILTNPWFIGVQLLTILGQFLIIFKGGEAFDTKPLTGAQWGWSLLFGSLTIPLGALIRQVPDRYVAELFRGLKLLFLFLTAPIRNIWAKIFRKEKDQLGDGSQQELGAIENLVVRSSKALGGLATDSKTPATNCSIAESSAMGSMTEKIEIDLQALIDAAKQGRLADKEMLEIHPRTLKNDPILTPRSDSNLPPSQDPYILRHFVRTRRNDAHDSTRGPVRRQTVPARVTWVEPRRPAPARTRQQQNRRDWFSWEGWLRSRRR